MLEMAVYGIRARVTNRARVLHVDNALDMDTPDQSGARVVLTTEQKPAGMQQSQGFSHEGGGFNPSRARILHSIEVIDTYH